VKTYSTFAILALALAGCERHDPPTREASGPGNLQKYWKVPPFQLTERNGLPQTQADWLGKVWVVDFFYTTCPGPCPMMTSRLSDLHERIKDRSDVRLASISVDPLKDTPEVLQKYAERFQAGSQWLFFTGEKAAIFELASKGYKLSVTEDRTQAEPITHSTKLVLVDRTGWVRGFYEGVGEDQSARLIADIDRLLAEQP
jgi:protein SCO1/2